MQLYRDLDIGTCLGAFSMYSAVGPSGVVETDFCPRLTDTQPPQKYFLNSSVHSIYM